MGILFDSSDDVINCGNVDSNLFSADFAIEAWIYVTNNSGWYTIVDKRTAEFAGTGFILTNINPSGRMFLRIDDDDFYSDNIVQQNTWTHVAVKRIGSTVTFYLNGVADGGGSSSLDGSGIADLMIGESINGLNFDGQITDVAIWSVALTSDEIGLLVDSKIKYMPLQIQPANLIMYLPMDDGAEGTSADGQIFRDESGNGNVGTGDDGGNNTGLTNKAEEVLTYPARVIYPTEQLLGIVPLLQGVNLGNDLYNGSFLGI